MLSGRVGRYGSIDRGDLGACSAEIALRHRRLALARRGTAPCRGWSRAACRRRRPSRPLAERVERRSSSSGRGGRLDATAGARRRGRSRAPQPVADRPSPRRWCARCSTDCGMLLGVPAVDREARRACAAAATAPCRPCLAPVAPARSGRAASRRAGRRAARRRRRPRRVVGLARLPRAPVPDDDVAAAVLAGRDHALEVEVLDGWSSTWTASRRTPGRASAPSGRPS